VPFRLILCYNHPLPPPYCGESGSCCVKNVETPGPLPLGEGKKNDIPHFPLGEGKDPQKLQRPIPLRRYFTFVAVTSIS
jgi:hypothetical protein